MPLAPDEEASITYSRPVYRHTFSTSQTRRRDSTGRYHVYFTFTGDRGGKPDTLTVYRIRHAGSSSLGADDLTGTR